MLKPLIAVNLFASGAHFAHNAVFLDRYPGPLWIPGPWFVVIPWCVLASALVRGYLWHQPGKSKRALVAVGIYCGSCVLVFGHYLYGAPTDFDPLTNALILMEGVAGVTLWVYFVNVERFLPP